MSDSNPNSGNGASHSDQSAGESSGEHKVEDIAKAGRDDLDTDDDQVAEGKWKSTDDGSGTSETD